MKKITQILLLFTCAISFAQIVPPTYSWSNKADYEINGEVTFKPGDMISVEITYTLGSTDGNADTFNFVLISLQDEAEANKGALDSGWSNTPVEGTTSKFPGPGTGGVTTASITIPESIALSSSTTDLTYRLLNYMAYNKGGGSEITYGGPNAGDPTIVYIRTQEEINSLSTKSINKSKLTTAHYDANNDVIVFDNNIKGAFKIYDILGRTASAGNIENTIDVSSLISGIYILTTEQGVLKFVK
ncbi:hypothetical protein AXE80_08300 [Wenyingzhuangia fucanilytica]|uniref:Secretion system C-terminal sorting domain-containing protein n=1 Tax=Wenyingzhuangia fucanilytica TaxID=1790137 RepID=A0A1B1Y6A8_9FLAO|nr:T9SS type A sorting domain-containing protein [Wenyingzhuangia fucanilytica]ANW96279.1 hypothetical protein AXE80_08300 [Wenyingzhuangia fucanilytica]